MLSERVAGLGSARLSADPHSSVGTASTSRMSSTCAPSTSWISLAQELDQVVAAQLEDELVDGPAPRAVEDVDGHDVPAHGPDAAGHLAQRARAVGQAYPHYVASHYPTSRFGTYSST